MRVYELLEDQHRYYIISEYEFDTSHFRYLEGGELYTRIIKRNWLNEEDVAKIVR
jgi:hypothetical protein